MVQRLLAARVPCSVILVLQPRLERYEIGVALLPVVVPQGTAVDVTGDTEHPRTCRCRSAIPLSRSKRFQEGLLRQIARLFSWDPFATKEAQDALVVLVEEYLCVWQSMHVSHRTRHPGAHRNLRVDSILCRPVVHNRPCP